MSITKERPALLQNRAKVYKEPYKACVCLLLFCIFQKKLNGRRITMLLILVTSCPQLYLCLTPSFWNRSLDVLSIIQPAGKRYRAGSSYRWNKKYGRKDGIVPVWSYVSNAYKLTGRLKRGRKNDRANVSVEKGFLSFNTLIS
jgi:hypothetical protein